MFRQTTVLLLAGSGLALSFSCKPAPDQNAYTPYNSPSAFEAVPTAEVKGTLQGKMGTVYWSMGGAVGSSVHGVMSLLFGIGRDQVRCNPTDHAAIEDPRSTHDEIEISVPNQVGIYKKSTATASSRVLQHRRSDGSPGAQVVDWTTTLSSISATRVVGSASVTFASPDAGTVAGSFDIPYCGEYAP